MRTFWKVGILGFLACCAIGAAVQPQPKELTETERAANERRSRELTAISYAKTVIPKQLRDPASATFGKINAHTDRKFKGKPVTAVCGAVNGKNGFGGFTGMQEFVFIAETNSLVFDNNTDNSKFVELWNSLCAGKHN